ncbi:MAG: proprotein convertase P-domain-containing protein [Phycisphaerales bacterium]
MVVAALVVAAGSAVSAPVDEGAKYDNDVMSKGDGSPAAHRAAVNSVFEQTRGPAPRDTRVVYGADDRKEVYEYDTIDPMIRQMAEACAIVVSDSEIMDNGDGTYTLFTSPWVSQGGTLCLTEPFRGQPQIGFCSSFLVGPDIITTAGHCVDAGDISSGVAFVFGFQLNDSDETGPAIVPADYVYFGTGIIAQTLSGDDDYSVVQLDRPVVGINPVPVRRTGTIANGDPLVMIGHPAAILKKIAGGATECKNNSPAEYFQANTDSYGGNSGSMVINANTYEVEGILVRGAPDYVTVGGCVQTNYVPDTGNTGSGLMFEEVSKATRFADFIPPLGILVSPGGTVTHYGVVGGPFTSPTVDYTLSNTTSSPADYEVSLTNAAAGVLIDGGTSMLTGTIPANGTAMVSVTLDNATVNALAAGIYSTGIVFDDTTNSISTTVTHTVEVGQTLVSISPTTGLTTGGPIGGPFPGSQVYTVTSERPTPVDVEITAPSWIDVSPSSTVSLSGEGDFQDVTISIGGDAATLAAGLYTGSVIFTNMDNLDQVQVPVSLDVGRYIFPSTDTPLAISDNSSFDSLITFTEDICVGDVDVDVDLTHTYSGDLILTLTSPQGTSVVLHNRTGSSDDFTPRRYDDEPGYTLPDGPGMLSDFDGEIAAGTWILTVEDTITATRVPSDSWSLRVASDANGCPPAAFDSTVHVPNGLATATRLRPRRRRERPITYTITSLPTYGTLWQTTGGSILSVPTSLPADEVLYRTYRGRQRLRRTRSGSSPDRERSWTRRRRP